jgi:signal transduction histidine kinase
MSIDNKKIIAAFLFFMVTIILFGYYRFEQEKDHINQTVNETLLRSVKIATVVAGDMYHDRVSKIPPCFQEERLIISELSELAKAEQVEYIYTMMLDENKTLRFTSSSASDEELRTGKNLTHFNDAYEANSKILGALNNQKTVFTNIEDQWGHFRSIFVGHTSLSGNRYVIGADIKIDSIDELSRMAAFKALVSSMVILFGALPFLILYRYVARKNNIILEEQVQLATQNLKDARDNAILAMNNAQEANRAKDTFLSNMSHELRTPLNAIIGFSQILAHRSDLSDGVKSIIEKINISGKNLLTLVNTLLDFSKIESGKMELQAIEFNLAQLMSEVIILVESMAQKKELSLQLHVDTKLVLMADRQLFKQVLINLITNAIKFSPHSSIINLEYHREQNKEIFGIRDQGIGIDATDIATLFDPFVQIREKQDGSIKGTGLGLTIVKKIIELHGGEIWVESIVGEGSCFYFSIPRAVNQ